VTFSDEYLDLFDAGPVPGRIDPWAEHARYFQQIHSGMIAHILETVQRPLRKLGYYAAKEISLQVMGGREPDISFRRAVPSEPAQDWNYAAAAVAAAAEPGIEATLALPELQSIGISYAETGELITVLEIISPKNKEGGDKLIAYRQRRDALLHRGINIVEIDSTRSRNRMLEDVLTELYPYHIAVYLPSAHARVISVDFDAPLKRFALPLRHEVIAVETHAAYEYAYRSASIPTQIVNEDGYRESALPFPSLMPDGARSQLLEAVERWREQLAALRGT
jgi:hypothetical protein